MCRYGKKGKREWEGGKMREGKVRGVVPHPKQKSGCATEQPRITTKCTAALLSFLYSQLIPAVWPDVAPPPTDDSEGYCMSTAC